jgi:hypothetical protein
MPPGRCQLIGFTATDIQTADRLILSVTTGAARITWDHGYTNPQAPTTLIGQRIPNNNYPLFVLQGRSNTAAFKITRDAGTDAVVTITLESD